MKYQMLCRKALGQQGLPLAHPTAVLPPLLRFAALFAAKAKQNGGGALRRGGPALRVTRCLTAFRQSKRQTPVLVASLCVPLLLMSASFVVAEDEDAQTHYVFGVGYQDIGQFEEAIENYTKAIERDPSYAEAYHGRGVAYASQGRLEEA
ncbi:MAG TPA: hypothetical protein DDX89_04680, partial [Candidatus Omnitrophica bacterium]|nr:hypothetical protein [Candidatus Omnitrophota bacterium]